MCIILKTYLRIAISHILLIFIKTEKENKDFFNGTSKSLYHISTILAIASNVLKSITDRDSKWNMTVR